MSTFIILYRKIIRKKCQVCVCVRQRESERERRREGKREIKLQVWCGKRLNMSRMVVWEDVYIVVLHIRIVIPVFGQK